MALPFIIVAYLKKEDEMDHTLQTKHGHGFYIILSLFTLIYPLGVFFLLFAWLNVQSYDLLLWQPNTLLLYALAFLIGCVSIYGIWRKKKWGVYTGRNVGIHRHPQPGIRSVFTDPVYVYFPRCATRHRIFLAATA